MHLQRLILTLLSGLFLATMSVAQTRPAAKQRQMMSYTVENGDTVYQGSIRPARVYQKLPRKKGSEWRKYYRLVHNFAVVYPYALVASDLVAETDSTIKARGLKYISKDKYVNAIVKDLFRSFEKDARNMTVSQGQMMMKLIDRECGISSYKIIKEFKNGYAAGFWQGVAKIFGNDLKKPYDPKGEDAPIEELVKKWHDGDFERIYYEIFWKLPPEIKIPEKYLKKCYVEPYKKD